MTRDRDEDRFGELDDTLADGPAPAEVPDEAREWLADQRAMHGLLRSLHTADAAAREDRVASIMTRIDGRADGSTDGGRARHWLVVAAAALVLATFGVWLALPPSLPTAEAAMARAADELSRDVDRRFRVELTVPGRLRADRRRYEFDLITRPGMKFLIEGSFRFAGLRIAEGRIGSDGEQLWIEPGGRRERRSGPLAERGRLLEGFGEILDVGYLDVHALVAKLPGGYRLRTVGRSTDAHGNPQLRIEAKRRGRGGEVRLRSAELLVDEVTGLVTRLEADLLIVGAGRRHLEIEYLGVVEPGAVDYSRPW